VAAGGVPVSLIGGLLVALAMLSLGGFMPFAGRSGRESGSEDDDPALPAVGPSRALDHGHRLGHARIHRTDTPSEEDVAAADHGAPRCTRGRRWRAKNVHNFVGPILIVGVVVDDRPLPAVQLVQQGKTSSG